jgi:hypothetical protein
MDSECPNRILGVQVEAESGSARANYCQGSSLSAARHTSVLLAVNPRALAIFRLRRQRRSPGVHRFGRFRIHIGVFSSTHQFEGLPTSTSTGVEREELFSVAPPVPPHDQISMPYTCAYAWLIYDDDILRLCVKKCLKEAKGKWC